MPYPAPSLQPRKSATKACSPESGHAFCAHLLPFGLYLQATVPPYKNPHLLDAREVLETVEHTAPHASLLRIVGISCAASMLASLLGSLGSVANALVRAPHLYNFIAAPFYFVLVMIVSLIISIPFCFVIGVPTLWALRSVIPKNPILMTVLLGLAGCLLGIPIEDYLNRNSIQRGDDVHLYMAGGALVGSAHALILVWDRNRQARKRALTEID